MVAWVGTLSAQRWDNWAVCKKTGLWGTNCRSGGGVRRGDELYIWQAGEGWLARCRADGPARAPRGVEDVPWPDPLKYLYIWPITVVAEAAPPMWMSGQDLRDTLGLPTVRLAQFPRIDDESAVARLRELFP